MKVPKAQKCTDGYKLQLRLDGKSLMVYGRTARECEANALALKAQHAIGKNEYRRSEMTLTQAIDKYIDDRSRVLSPSTVRGYRCIQKNYFQDAMRQRLDAPNWQRIINADTHSPKTVKNAWCFISSVLKDNGLPVPSVRLPQQIVQEHPFLQPDQILTFVEAVRGTEVEIPALLGLHSLRRSEIYDLDWNDVDLKADTILVSGSAVQDENNVLIHKPQNKNASSRRVVPIMIPQLHDALAAVPEKRGLVVNCYLNAIYKRVNSICKDNDLPLIGVHGLRHSFVSLAYHLGWSEQATMRVGGYSDFSTMRKIYTHLADIDQQNAVNSMSAFFSKS